MALPDEETIALEFAARWKVDAGDIKVAYSFKDGQRKVLFYGRDPRIIDCSENASWIAVAKACLRMNEAFDLVKATKADLAEFDPVARAYADWFQWSDASQRIPRRRFRPISPPDTSGP